MKREGFRALLFLLAEPEASGNIGNQGPGISSSPISGTENFRVKIKKIS